MDRGGDAQQDSVQADWPWPNLSTTLRTSGKISSDVSFADVNEDGVQDAIFLSTANPLSDVSVASLQQADPVLRVVLSGSFREQFNLQSLTTWPFPSVKFHVVDIDVDGSAPELLYLSQDRRFLVVVTLHGASRGQERHRLPVVEPINPLRVRGMISKRVGRGLTLEIGDNIVFFNPGQSPTLVSARSPLDGGWTEWSDPICNKRCGTDGMTFQLRSCTQPAPLNGGAPCAGEAYQEQVGCPGLTLCRPTDCLAHEMFQPANGSATQGNCVPDPNYVAYTQNDGGRAGTGVTGGGGLTGGGGTTPGGGSGTPVTNPQDCPAGKVWDPRLFYCFTPYTLSDIWIRYVERIWGGSDEGMREIIHRYRLSLNHPRAVGVSDRTTASMYCTHRGYADVISFQTATYTVTPATQNVFILCHPVSNGLFYGGNRCPVGWYDVSFAYRDMTHPVGTQVTYLSSVTCRRDEGFITNTGGNTGQPL